MYKGAVDPDAFPIERLLEFRRFHDGEPIVPKPCDDGVGDDRAQTPNREARLFLRHALRRAVGDDMEGGGGTGGEEQKKDENKKTHIKKTDVVLSFLRVATLGCAAQAPGKHQPLWMVFSGGI